MPAMTSRVSGVRARIPAVIRKPMCFEVDVAAVISLWSRWLSDAPAGPGELVCGALAIGWGSTDTLLVATFSVAMLSGVSDWESGGKLEFWGNVSSISASLFFFAAVFSSCCPLSGTGARSAGLRFTKRTCWLDRGFALTNRGNGRLFSVA